MVSFSFKRIMVAAAVLAATFMLSPSIWAAGPVNPPPTVGTVPVYDGGKRAQWRGYHFRYDSWWRSNSRFRRAPGARQSSPDWFFNTAPD
jgi:hypothetical protein